MHTEEVTPLKCCVDTAMLFALMRGNKSDGGRKLFISHTLGHVRAKVPKCEKCKLELVNCASVFLTQVVAEMNPMA